MRTVTTPVSFEGPAGACHCRTHIHGEMTRLHAALHIQRVVIVTPSVYGTDNESTLRPSQSWSAMLHLSLNLTS